jgi:tetratricopeptide (TPR) repeat protein
MSVLSVDSRLEAGQLQTTIRLLDGPKSLEAEAVFDFSWNPQDQEDLRWYLEDYLTYPVPPAPQIARRIENRISQAGTDLFSKVFLGSADTSRVWRAAVTVLADLRIELRTGQPQVLALPWELLREPNSLSPLALSCRSFVRVQLDPSRPPIPVSVDKQTIRVLLVICRPGGAADVPFRSIATHLLNGLHSGGIGSHFQVEVLRPPTFGNLNRVLRRAADNGQPYHIVHFDGHGLTGGLVFESQVELDNREIVEAQRVGRALADARVPVLVLNACRSAYSDPPLQPADASSVHENIRVFGSLAQVVADQGLPCVMAMRYSVYVETAARFMLDFYSTLAKGSSVGNAVNFARSQLEAEPMRQSFPSNVRLEDWTVPIVFEASPVVLAGNFGSSQALQPAEEETDDLTDLPRRPDAGFFGRDETLLALDRAFDSQNVVLLHSFAGNGKTATASEFARWYFRTGGTRGPVLFTSYDTKRTLGQVIDQLGRRMESELAKAGIQWAAITDPKTRKVLALEVCSKHSVFWIWDNVEPIAGFPSGTDSAWDVAEQTELADFLRDASERGAKFLLTSRRDESGWLGMLPARLGMPPMPFRERVQLMQALARKMGRHASSVADWRPLLEFTQGNPLALTVLVAQALRERLTDVGEFVSELQSGAAELRDDPQQGRSRSLTASLNYGLEHAYTNGERKAISLLHFFQAFVNVQVFSMLIAYPKLTNAPALSPEGIKRIFEVGAEIGILEEVAQGIYRIHPVLPWFFRSEFDKYFGQDKRNCNFAFCVVMGFASASLSKQFNSPNSDAAAGALQIEEANLRHALKIAINLEEWNAAAVLMHGLEDIYVTIQRNVLEWRKLVLQVAPQATDGTGCAIRGRELLWRSLTEYQMRIADDERRYGDAEHLARLLVEYYRKDAAPYLEGHKALKDGYEEIHNLSVMLNCLADYLGHQGRGEGVVFDKESYELSLRNGDYKQAATCAQGLGWAFREVEAIRNFDEAEDWFDRALELVPVEDSTLKGKILSMQGAVFLYRLLAALERRNGEEAAENVELAINAYREALELLPEYAYEDRAECLGNLGTIFLKAGELTVAENFYRESLPLAREAGAIRFEIAALLNIASALKEQGRLSDAAAFARAAEQTASAMGLEGQPFTVSVLEMLASIREAERKAGNA